MDKYRQILTKYWGFSDFRPLQEEIIQSIVQKNDTIGLMPTGGGKSITFQIPVLTMEGICLVITPLIALIKDQTESLQQKGIKAAAIYSGMSYDEINVTLNNCIYGGYKFLYISPERIETEIFKKRIEKLNISLVTIDEAHCVSQWGYDFRPSYLKIANLREKLSDIPFLSLTATATIPVIEDIKKLLKLKDPKILRKSFERKNLIYIVREVEDKQGYLLKILKKVKGSGIIYVRSRKGSRELCQLLRNNSISSHYYHAGIKSETRSQRQNDWKKGKVRVMVATNAFGMGIDKSDVRIVAHYDIPDSIEAYFQEAGRAGRDEKTSYAVLLHNKSDINKLEKRITTNFPEISEIKRTYQALGNYLQVPLGGGKGQVFDFQISDFASKYKLPILQAYNSLKFMQREGYIELTDELDNPSKIHFIIDRNELYKFQVANATLDSFIKLLLRSYSGLFSEYVKVNEKQLAQRAGINIENVFKLINKLSTLKVINYIPQKKTPLLIYTEERLEDKSIFISKENYEERKKSYQERINAILDYISSTAKCRSQYLLHYFNEENAYRCGTCDICKKRNELNLSRYEFDMILEKIKELLNDNEYSIDNLIELVPFNDDKVIKVIQWLLDNYKIIRTKEDKLKWHE